MHQALLANRAGKMLDLCTVNDLYRPRPVQPYAIPDSSFRGAKKSYRKIPKITASGLLFFKGPFLGAYIRRGLCTEGNLRFKID